MRHIAAYLLLQIGGNANPSAGDVKKVLGAVGIEADEERLSKLISELGGKDINAVSHECLHAYCVTDHSLSRPTLSSFSLKAPPSSLR